MEGTLLVNPQQLKNTANSFSSRAQSVNRITVDMMNKVRSMKSAFDGEAGSKYINQFNKLQEDMNQIQRKIKEHVEDLNQMASNYESTENQNIQTNVALQTNYI